MALVLAEYLEGADTVVVDCVDREVEPNEVKKLYDHLNSIEPAIQFTKEMEESFPSLIYSWNVGVICDGFVPTSVYWKTHTDRYLLLTIIWLISIVL